MLPHKTRLRIIELRAQGTSFQGIANNLDISKTTVIRHCKSAAKEITALRAVEVETTFSTCTEFAEKRREGLLFLADYLRDNIERERELLQHDVWSKPHNLTKNLQKNVSAYLQVLKEMNAPDLLGMDARSTQLAIASASER